LHTLSFSYFDNRKTGHLVARLTKYLEEIGEIARHGLEDVFIAVMTLIGAFSSWSGCIRRWLYSLP
jgi:ATP-binding cassette subfamily B protein